MADIITHEFGKDHREAARAYGRLVGILDAQAEAFIGNPAAFFEDAGKRIADLQRLIESAKEALRQKPVMITNDDSIAQTMDLVSIPQDEYERLHRCAAILRSGIPE